MGDPFRGQAFPRPPLLGAGVLVGLTLLAALWGRSAGPEPGAVDQPVVAVRELRFVDRDDGAVVVLDAADGTQVRVLAPGTNGFVRGALRGLARERRMHGGGDTQPFRLALHADGRVVLHDPVTGHRVELQAFGESNAGAFAGLLARADGRS